jgi:hypothetical protein
MPAETFGQALAFGKSGHARQNLLFCDRSVARLEVVSQTAFGLFGRGIVVNLVLERGWNMLKEGAALRFPIRDARGVLLLAQGSLVNDRLRKVLEVRGISLEIQVSLKVLQGEQIGLEIQVNKPLFLLGRRPECDLQLASHVVSGHHCRIIKTKFEAILSDLNSSNGTFLNGRRLARETELNDNDQIRVGHFIFSTQIFAAMAADSNAGEMALKAWVLEETSATRKPTSQYSRTEADIDLDSLSGEFTNSK